MSHLDQWAHLIAKQLKSQAELVATQAASDLYSDGERNAFIRMVLEPFLPGSYAVGSGRVIDAAGHISEPQDIIIYRNDYPRFNLPGSQDAYIYESVLATIQVRSKLIRKSFFSALDQCASLGTLNPVIHTATRQALAERMGLQANAKQQFVHSNPLHTGRFDLIGRPQTFIYGFSGYQTSAKQLAENLSKWIDQYHEEHDALQLRSLPSVIATQGCFAWRNTAPFAIKQPVLMGVGNDPAPLRLILLQMLHAMNQRLQSISEGHGIKANIAPYLASFKHPDVSETVGRALNPGQSGKEVQSHPGSALKPTEVVAGSVNSTIEQGNSTVAPKSQAERKPASTSAPQASDRTSPASPVTASPAQNTAPPVGGSAAEATANKPSDNETSQVQAPPTPVIPNKAVADSAQSGTVIEDRTIRPAQAAGAIPGTTQQGNASGKAANPLSLFKDGDQAEVEDYQFEPIDHFESDSNDPDADAKTPSDDSPFLTTQEIDTSDYNQQGDSQEEFQKTVVMAGSPGQDNGSAQTPTPLQTPDKTTANAAKPGAEPRKTEYVTESLI